MTQPTDHFRILKILHLSLLTGLGLFAVISFFTAGKNFTMIADESLSRKLQVVVLIFSLTMLIAGFNHFKKTILNIRVAEVSAHKRMEKYRTACIIWWAMIEGPGLMAIIGYLLTANHAFLFLGMLHIFILFIFMPRKDNIIVLLNFNSDETMQLEGKR